MERIEKKELKKLIRENVKTLYRKTLENASPEELYQAAVFAVRDVITDKWMKTHDEYYERDAKVVYYLSMEFLMGRFFGNALINLEMFDEVKEVFAELGIDYNMVEEAEPDPGLGNGGLGRLAACFLESLSTLSLPAYGCGIRYHYGIFEQRIENGYQVEVPDNWLENGDPWGIKRNEYAVEVKFGGNVRAVEKGNGEYRFVQENYQSVTAIPYDYPVIGYGNNTVNTLRLWEAKPKTRLDLKSFNEGNYQKAAEDELLANTLTDVLYPADEHIQGKELRLRQQYFFISATVQRVIARFKKKHTDFNELPDKVAFQLNDTHPSMAVAELMRVLVDENDLPWDQAWDITRRVCAYTNHTILAEALEKWPMWYLEKVVPQLVPIIKMLDVKVKEKYSDPGVALIDENNTVHMAHIDIHYSSSVNGVAYLHTEILKNSELKPFYDLYPEKFNNKTNGITFRRWLMSCNPELSAYITELIGDGWKKDANELEKLGNFINDDTVLTKLVDIKNAKKTELASYLKKTQNLDVPDNSIFDIQVKRLHEYKRQQLNVLYIIRKYFEIKAGKKPSTPITCFFGAKAAPAYIIAKDIIHAILCLQQIINNDPEVSPYLKVFMVENYNVTLAEKLFPAANISEQISVGMAKEILTDVSEDTESRDAYYQECLQQMREAVETEPGAAQMLERGEVNTSTSNLLAAQALLEDPAELFSDLQRYRKKYNKEKEIPVAATGEEPAGTEASGLWEQLDQQNFADDYRTMLQDALQETETISLEQAESHLDVKQLQLVHKQLRLAGNLQNRQEYFLPMYLGDQLAGVHLTLQQGTGETSAVDIRVDAGDEQLEAHLQVNGEHIEGYLVGNTPEEVTKLEKTSDIFLEWIQTDTSADWKAEKLSVVSSRDMTRMAAGEPQNAETIESPADAAPLYRLAKGFLQAVADSSGK